MVRFAFNIKNRRSSWVIPTFVVEGKKCKMSKTYECWEKKSNDNLGYGAVRTKLLPRLDYQPLFGNWAYLKPRLRQIVPRDEVSS